MAKRQLTFSQTTEVTSPVKDDTFNSRVFTVNLDDLDEDEEHVLQVLNRLDFQGAEPVLVNTMKRNIREFRRQSQGPKKKEYIAAIKRDIEALFPGKYFMPSESETQKAVLSIIPEKSEAPIPQKVILLENCEQKKQESEFVSSADEESDEESDGGKVTVRSRIVTPSKTLEKTLAGEDSDAP